MDLNESQLQAVQNGEIVPVVIDHMDCFVLRRETLEQMNQVTTIREQYPAVIRVLDHLDANEDYSDL